MIHVAFFECPDVLAQFSGMLLLFVSKRTCMVKYRVLKLFSVGPTYVCSSLESSWVTVAW